MLFRQSLVAAASLAALTAAHPSPSPFAGISFSDDAYTQLEKRAGSVVITGANGHGDDDIHSRLEISDLASRSDQWSIFIQTMQKFQDVSQSNATGYYQIAGIHGVPRQDWDGVGQCDECGDADGYCTHDSVLFPAWHRVYMALFEQEFLKISLEVANSYPSSSRARMLAAQSTLRFPYWDWSANPDSGSSTLPSTISSPSVTIEGPSGQETVANPLYTYRFSDSSDLYYGPFTTWPETLRWPNSNDPDAVSQEQSTVNAFENIRSNLQDQIYQLLTVCDDYLHFSNDDAGSSSSKCSNSLEAIHNTIHNTAGGPGSSTVSSGHMTYLSLAAFDPIFWLHHCNVDRLFALWQTVHPGSYGASQVAPHNTWSIASGSTQDVNSPLRPFRKDASGNFWTSGAVQDWANTFHYTYPEFSTSDGSKSAIVAYINSLYGPDATATAGSISELVNDDVAVSSSSSSTKSHQSTSSTKSQESTSSSSAASATSTATSSGDLDQSSPTTIAPISIGTGITAPSLSNIGWNATASVTATTFTLPPAIATPSVPANSSFTTPNNGSSYQYVCNVNTPRYALNGSYYVYVFDGTPASEDASTWLASSNLVGVVGVLAGGDMMNPNLLVAGSIPLTRTLQKLVKSGKIQDMSEDHCIPYLKEHLTWRISKDGAEVDVQTVPGFKASVYSSTSTAPKNVGLLPEWSEMVPQVEVTKHKAGGAVSADWSDNTTSSGADDADSYGSDEIVTITMTATSTIFACPATATATLPW
nr:tyrosinase [Quercus suber]